MIRILNRDRTLITTRDRQASGRMDSIDLHSILHLNLGFDFRLHVATRRPVIRQSVSNEPHLHRYSQWIEEEKTPNSRLKCQTSIEILIGMIDRISIP